MAKGLTSKEVRTEADRQLHVIARGVVDLLPKDELREKLEKSISDKRPLRIKQGFDPTSADIHLGHTVGIRKLKQFQDLGHTIVLIIGDYTSLVGDPSGLSATRPQLGYDEIMRNAETYQEQFFRILDRSKTEVRFNGEWFEKMQFKEIINLLSKYTVARLLGRDDFDNRLKAGTPISVHELLYPLMQAYDSVAIKADVELGATEQKFNLLAGRVIQEAYGVEPQSIITMPILVGTDGVRKMSKSLDNYIGITESPREIFGKIMSIRDDLIHSYYELTTESTPERLNEIRTSLDGGSINPMNLKKELGMLIVDMYHSAGSGEAAREEFERVFSQKQLPDSMPCATRKDIKNWELAPNRLYLVHLMTKAELTRSNGEARKLIQAGGVSLDGERIVDVDYEFALNSEMILKVGKRRYLKLVP